jgi:hypothetical protein
MLPFYGVILMIMSTSLTIELIYKEGEAVNQVNIPIL